MTDHANDKDRKGGDPKAQARTQPKAPDARKERLRAALRANLQRRKQQARVRAGQDPEQDGGDLSDNDNDSSDTGKDSS